MLCWAAGKSHLVIIFNKVYKSFEIDFVITSVLDGKHAQAHSLHYSGNAFDIRTRNIPTKGMIDQIVNEIRNRLTKDFDIVLESDHIHIEYQPTFTIPN